MIKKTLKLASLTFLMFGCAVASEFRPPMSADRGSQRLDMKAKRGGDSAWELDMYSTAYNRNATKTFTKHGTKTAPLSALIFGKDNFKVSDALTSALTKEYTEELNANLGATRLYPRVSYSEQGLNLGGKLGYRVYGGKGMLGLKVNVPLKTVRMERDNTAETNEQGFADNVIRSVIGSAFVPLDNAGMAGAVRPVQSAANSPVGTLSSMYRVSFIKNMPVLDAAKIHGFIDKNTANDNISVAAVPYAQDRVAEFGLAAQGNPKYTDADSIPFVFFYQPDSRIVPSIKNRAVRMGPNVRQNFNGGVGEIVIGRDNDANRILNTYLDVGSTTPAARVDTRPNFGTQPNADAPFAALTELPLDGAQLKPNVLYVPRGRNDAGDRAAYLKLFEDYGDNLWIMTTHLNTGALTDNGTGDALAGRVIDRFGSESAEQWLWRNGYAFATNQRTGLGDITVTPCYDHMFSRSWHGGVYLHLLIPTGGSRKTGDNPYKARLGNDNHVELGGGANVAWQAMDWMNLRLDAMAAYALPAKERVSAPFKGATVKNVGPAIDVDVDYTRLKASLDTTMVHPSASSLATTIGYDFEYKTKDNVSLKNKKHTFKTLADDANSWFGGFWDNGAGAFRAKEVDLDSAVQAVMTERISHNLRVESSWHATQHLSLFWGGSTPLFGQNVAKMNTIYGGMNVKF